MTPAENPYDSFVDVRGPVVHSLARWLDDE